MALSKWDSIMWFFAIGRGQTLGNLSVKVNLEIFKLQAFHGTASLSRNICCVSTMCKTLGGEGDSPMWMKSNLTISVKRTVD